jgi:beta-glucanase (GH16 family)
VTGDDRNKSLRRETILLNSPRLFPNLLGRVVWFVSFLGVFAAIPAAAQNWGTPVWSDEFDGALGTPIDTAKWTFETGILNVNNEVEYYCAPASTAGGCNITKPNAYLDGSGHLIMQAIKVSSSTAPYSGSWTSARMTTNGTKQFQYGRVESKMMLPVGAGIWPAFWALGANFETNQFGNPPAPWPNCGEIDYMENVPAVGGLGPTKVASTMHQGSTTGLFSRGQTYTLPSGDVTGYHTYGAIWSPNMIQFYADDPANVFFVHTAADVPAGNTFAFNHSFFLLLNLAMGGDGAWPGPTDATTPNPAVMTVDYVRLYQPTAVAAPNFGSPAGITVKAGATTGNSSTLTVGETAGSGRIFLSCNIDAPNASCLVKTNDALSGSTLDFSSASTGTATVTITTAANGSMIPWRFTGKQIGGLELLLGTLFVVVFCALLRSAAIARRRVRQATGSLVLVTAGLLLGCAGGSSANPRPLSGVTTPGNYTITVRAYTVTGTGTTPDATVRIPITVD